LREDLRLLSELRAELNALEIQVLVAGIVLR
jgi:hypothetical protein